MNTQTERCFACDKALGRNPKQADTRDDQIVVVGSDCYKRIEAAGDAGYQPPKGGPRLFPLEPQPDTTTALVPYDPRFKFDWGYVADCAERALVIQLRNLEQQFQATMREVRYVNQVVDASLSRTGEGLAFHKAGYAPMAGGRA